MKSKKKKTRPNQKAKRKPHREEGVFTKDGTLRIVQIHPTNGYKEANGEYGRQMFQEARDKNEPIVIQRGANIKKLQPVTSNAPKVRHNKIG